MSNSEGRNPYTSSSRSRRRRKLQKRKRYASLILHFLIVVLLACTAFYIGTKVVGQIEEGNEVQTANSGLTESGDADSDSPSLSADDENETVLSAASAVAVVVDPGHGGSDPGATVTTLSGEIYEKDINLSIALFLETMLTDAGFQVILTRDTDTKVSLETRVEICNKSDAELFISIHQNILEDDAVTSGIETWYWTGSSDGLLLAACLQDSVADATGATDLGVKESTDLYVLHHTDVPAVLLESGFLSCEEELENLLDSAYQKVIAQGILEGILKYLD